MQHPIPNKMVEFNFKPPRSLSDSDLGVHIFLDLNWVATFRPFSTIGWREEVCRGDGVGKRWLRCTR